MIKIAERNDDNTYCEDENVPKNLKNTFKPPRNQENLYFPNEQEEVEEHREKPNIRRVIVLAYEDLNRNLIDVQNYLWERYEIDYDIDQIEDILKEEGKM